VTNLIGIERKNFDAQKLTHQPQMRA
jgi:hypothetical protein